MPFDNFAPPVDLRDFLDAFGGEFTEVTEIWLFGSRAEGLADARDWDLLVFSDDRLTPEAVSPAVHFRSDEFTLFIAVRDIFRRPWRRTKDGVTEEGSFTAGNGNSTGIERRMTALRTLRTSPTVTRAGSQLSGCGNGSQNLTNPGRA